MIKRKPLPSVDYLRDCLVADFGRGTFKYKERPEHHFPDAESCRRWNRRCAGLPAFITVNHAGYLLGNLRPHGNLLAHRVLWKMATGEEPESLDHIDGNPRNNSLSNLRAVTHAENHRNVGINRSNTSGVPGVVRSGKFWLARIADKHVGCFSDFSDAVRARKLAEVQFGYHPNHCKRLSTRLAMERLNAPAPELDGGGK